MASLDEILAGLTAQVNEPPKKQHPTKQISLPFRDATNQFKGKDGNLIEDKIVEEFLDGIIVKRIPMPIPDFHTYKNIPSFTYQLHNTRKEEVKVILSFEGTNLSVLSGATCVKKGDNVVEGYLKPNESSHMCSVEPLNKAEAIFQEFKVRITAYPVHTAVKEETLKEVTLFTRVNFGVETIVEYEALNRNTYDVMVEVKLTGNILKPSKPLPFQAIIKPNERAFLGSFSHTENVQQSWRWETAPSSIVKPNTEKSIFKNEAEGVIMTQIQTPGEPNLLELEVENTQNFNVIVEVDFEGATLLDVVGGGRPPLKAPLKAREKKRLFQVHFKGSVALKWGWKEDR